jgi:hypothetical protein
MIGSQGSPRFRARSVWDPQPSCGGTLVELLLTTKARPVAGSTAVRPVAKFLTKTYIVPDNYVATALRGAR